MVRVLLRIDVNLNFILEMEQGRLFSEKMDLSVLTVVAERALARCCQGLTRGIMSIRPNMHIPVLELTE
jgi:hypothetical protein